MKTYLATFSNDNIQESATFTANNAKEAKDYAWSFARRNFKEKVSVSVKLKK